MNTNRPAPKDNEAPPAPPRWRFTTLPVDADDDEIEDFIRRLTSDDEEFAARNGSDEPDETQTAPDQPSSPR